MGEGGFHDHGRMCAGLTVAYLQDTTQLFRGYHAAVPCCCMAVLSCRGAVPCWHARGHADPYSQDTPALLLTQSKAVLQSWVLACTEGGFRGSEWPQSSGVVLTPHPAGAPLPPAPGAGPARVPAPRWQRRSCGSTR